MCSCVVQTRILIQTIQTFIARFTIDSVVVVRLGLVRRWRVCDARSTTHPPSRATVTTRPCDDRLAHDQMKHMIVVVLVQHSVSSENPVLASRVGLRTFGAWWPTRLAVERTTNLGSSPLNRQPLCLLARAILSGVRLRPYLRTRAHHSWLWARAPIPIYGRYRQSARAELTTTKFI